MDNNLAADIYSDATGKKWTARITRLLPGQIRAVTVWEKNDMPGQWHAETAMDAAWNRLQAADAAANT